MQTKEDFLAALDKMEADLKEAFCGLRGDPSRLGHDREMDMAITKLEESMMWMRRSIDRKFA